MKKVFQISLMLLFAMVFAQTSFAQTWQAQPDARSQDKKEATDRPTKPKAGNGSGTQPQAPAPGNNTGKKERKNGSNKTVSTHKY